MKKSFYEWSYNSSLFKEYLSQVDGIKDEEAQKDYRDLDYLLEETIIDNTKPKPVRFL
jgi:hypothetical protein